MNFLREFTKIFLTEKTKNIYSLPIPPQIAIRNILYDWPSHAGKYIGAVDFAVSAGTSVIAPLDGNVIEVIDQNDIYGNTSEFSRYLNYITIAHYDGEYSQLAHIAKNSVEVKRGDFVKRGEKLAVTGLNGWMQEPFLEHIHMFVFRVLSSGDFKGLQIRFVRQPQVG